MRKVSRGLLGYVAMIAAFIFLIVILSDGITGASKRIEYPQLLELIEQGEVDRVSIRGTSLVGRLKNSKISQADYPERAYDFETTIGADFYATVIAMHAKAHPDLDPETVSVNDLGFQIEYLAPLTTPWYLEILPYLIPVVLLMVMWFYIMRQQGAGGGKVMNFGKSRANMVDPAKNKVTFANVAGAEEEKEELKEIVDFLKNPKNYVDLGARIPKGVLLMGPPGTGKTLLAKAVAGEANVPFFSISGSDFVEMFVGVGASRVRDLFKQAAKVAPCIIFIDEIDAVGRSRDSKYGGNSEHEQTLNQLLGEIDGFDSSKGIVCLAATNRPEILDKALLRAGRFDRRIIVDKPNYQGRLDTLKVHTRKIKLGEDVDLKRLAQATAGAVGADLANLVNEAALRAVRNGRKAVTQEDLLVSFETVIAGSEKKNTVLTDTEKRLVAYHEVGHALVAALEKRKEPVTKITIVPHTSGALG